MNHDLYKRTLDPRQWAWTMGGASAPVPQAPQAPNFSAFSAPSDKPFQPQFGPHPDMPLAPPPMPTASISAGARKRRNDPISSLDLESRQRKVFISEERMLDHLQRLNLDQGPDLLQDVTSEGETHSLSGASEFSERAEQVDVEVDAASSIASDEEDIEFNDTTGESKVVLSDALKKFMERKPEVLPDSLLQQIASKPMGNPSGALVLWRPPGEHLRDVIRNSLARSDPTDAPAPEPLPAPTFHLAPKPPEEPEPSLRSQGCLPDLLIDQPACARRIGIFNPILPPNSPPNDGWSFEQMET